MSNNPFKPVPQRRERGTDRPWEDRDHTFRTVLINAGLHYSETQR